MNRKVSQLSFLAAAFLVALASPTAFAAGMRLASVTCPSNGYECFTTLTNDTSVPTRLHSWVIEGGNTAAFTWTADGHGGGPAGMPAPCSTTFYINPGESCTVKFSTKPSVGQGTYTLTARARYQVRIPGDYGVRDDSTSGTLTYSVLPWGIATLSVPACPPTATGSASFCGYATVTATGGPVIVWSTELSGNTGDFQVDTTNVQCPQYTQKQLENGQSCTVAAITFAPKTDGTRSLTLSTYISSSGTYVTGVVTGSPPYTYSWKWSTWGACTGGSGTWSYSAWSPSTGCGSVTQTRTATCNANPNSGTQTRSVWCERSDGQQVQDSYCSGSKPGTSQSCTPTSGFSCGTQEALSRTVTLTNACSGTASVSSVSCGSTGIGLTKSCGTVTLTASGGPILLGSTTYSASGSTGEFTLSTPGSGACTANQLLSSGASCNLVSVTHKPTSAGSKSVTISVTPAGGTAGSGTISGTGVYGTATLSVSGVSCSGTVGIASNCSGTATITATGGPVVLNATPVTKSGSHPDDFAVAAGTCAGATLSSGSSCSLGTITFTAGGTGTRTVTLTTNAASGTNTSVSLSGTGAAAGSASVSTVSCGNAGIGTTKSCTGTMTLTATGGAIRLGSPVYTVSGATTAFTYAAATTGACTAGSVLASGQSCNLITVSAFKPTVAGASTMTVTVAPTVGTTGSNTVSGVGVYGTALVAPTSLDCGSIGAGLTKNCGSFTITASGGQVQLGSPAFTNSNEDEFTVPAGTCTANKVLADGESCSTGTIVFEPNHVGASSATVRVNTIEGAGPTVTLSGTGLAGEANIIPTSLSCGEVTAGQTANCGTVTVTATGGPITFSSTPLSVTADFAVTPGSCTGGLTLSVGQSCTTGTVIFQPTTAGAKTGTLTVHCGSSCGGTVTLSGTSYTYSWKTGEWSEWSSTCSENATRTRAVFCERSDGVTVSDALCDASSRPADSETAQVLTTCTYSWIEGGFGACEGGHGVWVTGEWQPKLACGEVEQTRSVTCAFDVDSGSHSQTVVCRRSDGSIRPDEECDPATRPPTMKNCTPSDPKVCGERPEDTRTVTLDTSCVRDAILQVCTPKKESDRFCVATPL